MENIFRQNSISNLMDILLRVPLIFMMDIICSSKNCFTVDGWSILVSSLTFIIRFPTLLRSETVLENIPFPTLEGTLIHFTHVFGLLAILILFMQKTSHLVSFYLSALAIGVTISSNFLNEEYVKFCSELQHSSFQQELFALNLKAFKVFFLNYFLLTFLAVVFCFLTVNLPLFPKKIFLVFLLVIFPIIINFALPTSVLTIIPTILTWIILFILMSYFMIVISNVLNYIFMYFNSVRVFLQLFHRRYFFSSEWRNYVVFHVTYYIFMVWRDYHVSCILRVFGIIRLCKGLIYLAYDDVFTDYLENDSFFHFSSKQIQYIFPLLIIKSSDNIVAILGVTSVLSVLVDILIYRPMQKFLIVPENEQQNMSPIIFQLGIILFVQRGFTSLKPKLRLSVIGNIAMVIGAIILHQIHIRICEILTHLSATGIVYYNKHIRALIVTFLVFITSSSWMTFLLINFTLWDYMFCPLVMSVSLFNIEILVSLIISLIVYVLNIIHLHSYNMWYELYDYIYYLESINNIISFVLSFFLCFKGVYTCFESESLLKMIFVSGHFYHNIWTEAINGYKCLKKRHTISSCVNSLPIASERDIEDVGGVCAICFENIGYHITCRTHCRHFFHKYCLKAWLYERRICPMCYRIILHN